MCEFEMDFEKSICCGFNLSSDDIVSVLYKHVMLRFVTTYRSENGCGNIHIVWSEIGSGFGEPGGTPPPRTPRSTPRDVWTGPITARSS